MTININVYPDQPDVGTLAWRDGQEAVTRQIEDRVQRVVDQFGAIARAAGRLEFLIKDAHNTSGALNDLHRAIIREVDILSDVRHNARRLNDMVVHERTHDLENQLTGIDALIEALGGIDPQVHQALFPVAPTPPDENDPAYVWLERVLQYEAEHGQDRIMFQAARRQDAIEELARRGGTYLMLDVDLSEHHPKYPIWLLPRKFFDWATETFHETELPIWLPTKGPDAKTVELRDYMFRLLGEYRLTKPEVDGLVYSTRDRAVAETYVRREPVHHLLDGSVGPVGDPYWWVMTTDFVRFCKQHTTPDQPIPIWQPPPLASVSSNDQPPRQNLLYRVYELDGRYRERNRPFKGIIYAEARSADAIKAARSLEAMGEWAVIAQNLSIAGPQETWLVVSKRFVEFMREQDPDLLRQLPIWTPEPGEAPVPPTTPAPPAPTVPSSPKAEIARIIYDVREEQLATGYKVFPSSLAPVARRFKTREKAEDMRLAEPRKYALLDLDMSAYDPNGMAWWVLNSWFVDWLHERRPKLDVPLWDPMKTEEPHA